MVGGPDRLGHRPRRHEAPHALLGRVGLGRVRQQRRVDQAGQGVRRAHAVCFQFDRERFGEALHRVLGGGIDRNVGHAEGRGRGRGGEAQRTWRGLEQRDGEVDAGEHGGQVDVDHRQDVLPGHLLVRTAPADPSVVKQNVEAAAAPLGEGGQRGAVGVAVGDVDDLEPAVLRADLSFEPVQQVGLQIDRPDEPALLREQLGRLPAHARRGAGDEDRLFHRSTG